MQITREQIREDVTNYLIIHLGIIDISEGYPMEHFKLTDFDLIDMEMELEEKYGIFQNEDDEMNISGMSESDTLMEVVNKLFEYFRIK